MGLEAYSVRRDHFEPEDNTGLCFPCCACRHRHGTDREEPCIRCDWNLGAKGDDELPPLTPNAKVSGAGTASAGLTGSAAGCSERRK